MHTFVDFSHSFATDAHSRQKKPVELRMLKLTGLKNLETSESETGKHSWELNIFKLRWSRDFFASCVFVDVSFIKSNFGEFIRFFFLSERDSLLSTLWLSSNDVSLEWRWRRNVRCWQVEFRFPLMRFGDGWWHRCASWRTQCAIFVVVNRQQANSSRKNAVVVVDACTR